MIRLGIAVFLILIALLIGLLLGGWLTASYYQTGREQTEKEPDSDMDTGLDIDIIM